MKKLKARLHLSRKRFRSPESEHSTQDSRGTTTSSTDNIGVLSRHTQHLQQRSQCSSSAASHTTEPGKISTTDDLQRLRVEPLVCSVRLDPDSDLALVHKELHGALKKLETVLSKAPATLNFRSNFQDAEKRDSPISFADMVRELRALHDTSEKGIEARIGKVMTALHPLMKVGLGLTETVGASADSLLQDDYILNKLGKLRREKLDSVVVIAAVKMQIAITDFLREAILWLRKHYISKVTTAAISQDLNSARKALNRAKEALRNTLSSHLVLTVMSREADARRQEMLRYICSDQDYYLNLNKPRNINDSRLPQTGISILKDKAYKPWLNGKVFTLWCSGLAGAGKTFAASALIDDLEQSRDSDLGLAHYYCEFDQRHKQNIRSLVASLTRQLLTQNEDYFDEICDEVRIRGQALPLADVRVLLHKSIKAFRSTYVIIDALDEFASSQDQRSELAELLAKLREETGLGRLRLCITSRPANSIFEILSPATEILIRASEGDIAQYVRRAFECSRHGRSLRKQDSELVKDVVTAVVTKSDGIFKLAALQTEHAILAKNPQDARDTIKHLKTDIFSYYESAFERIQAKPAVERAMVIKLLTWVFYARDVLCLPMLSIALGIENQSIDVEHAQLWAVPDPESYISASEGLLTLKPYNSVKSKENWLRFSYPDILVCQLSHETVGLFLSNHVELLLPNGNWMILHAYINYLTQDEFRHFNNAASNHWINDVIWREKEEETNSLDPSNALWLFSLIAHSWGDYAEAVLEDLPELFHQIEEFLTAIDTVCKTKGPSPCTLLQYCIRNGWSILFQLLLSNGADPNLTNKGHAKYSPPYSPLAEALWSPRTTGREKIMKILLQDPRVDPNGHSWLGSSVLQNICTGELMPGGDVSLELMQCLLRRKDLNVNEDSCSGFGPLEWAIRTCRPGYVKLLLARRDIDLNACDYNGKSILSKVITSRTYGPNDKTFGDFLEGFRSLVNDKRLKVNARDRCGKTALHDALGDGLVVRLRYDGKLRLSSHFDWSRKMEVRLAIIRTLISSGRVEINLIDNKGHSVLDYAHLCISYLQTYLDLEEIKAIETGGQDAVNNLRCSFGNLAEPDPKTSKYFLACISMVLVRELTRMLKDAGELGYGLTPSI
ncbi:MAG: hypothetical protein Q9227_008969 [Pyrenula ochraceoflavens]